MAYVPRAVTQVDRTDPCWTTSCWAAVGSWQTQGATRGRRRPSLERFRKAAGVDLCRPGGPNDIRNGLKGIMYRGRSAWDWGNGRYADDIPLDRLEDQLANRESERLFWLATDFQVWDDEASVCQAGFNDQADAYHAIGVVAGLGKRQNKDKVRVLNPLCDRLKWVPLATVLRAVRRYDREHPGGIDAISIKPPSLAAIGR